MFLCRKQLIGHLHSLVFVFVECIFLFLLHTKDDRIKDQITNQHSLPGRLGYTGRLARETQALIWNFLICISNIIKDLSELLLFSKAWIDPSPSAKERNYLTRQFTVRISCLTMRSWCSGHNRESQRKTLWLGRFETGKLENILKGSFTDVLQNECSWKCCNIHR